MVTHNPKGSVNAHAKFKMKNNMRYVSQFMKIVKTYRTWFITMNLGADIKGMNTFFSIVEKIIQDKGIKTTIQGAKSVRLGYTKWLSSDPDNSISNVRQLKDGLPKIIREHLGEYHNIKDRGPALVLTILNIIRSIHTTVEPNLDDILNPFNGEEGENLGDEFDSYMDGFLKSSRIGRNNPRPQFRDGLYLTKRGPNGPSMSTMYSDIKLLDDKHLDEMRILAGDTFVRCISQYKRSMSAPGWEERLKDFILSPDEMSKKVRKISVIPSPEGKTRTIALGTYGDQNALEPLHRWAFKQLKKLKGDLTFDQGRGLSYLNKEGSNNYHSLDLKAATDRFPRRLQAKLLANAIDPEYAIAGLDIIEREFHLWNGGKASGNVGQPIGFLSSGAVFTLTHHFVIYVAHRKAKVPIFNRTYVILGDDIVISNDRVAEEYLKLITRLGVDISKIKSHCSPHSFEIGKRWIHKGKEISPFSMLPLHQAKTWSPTVLQAFREEVKRGWELPHELYNTAALYTCVRMRNFNSEFFVHSQKVNKINNLVFLAVTNKLQGNECIKELIEIFKLTQWPFDKMDNRIGDLIYKTITFEMFRTSCKSQGVRGAREYVFNSTLTHSDCIDHEVHPGSTLPHYVTIERFLKVYIEHSGMYSNSATAGTEEMDRPLRSLVIPDFKTIFSSHRGNLEVMQSNIFAKTLISRIKKIEGQEFKFKDDCWIPFVIAKEFLGEYALSRPVGLFGRIPSYISYVEEARKGVKRKKSYKTAAETIGIKPSALELVPGPFLKGTLMIDYTIISLPGRNDVVPSSHNES